jgi:hypothetical protein
LIYHYPKVNKLIEECYYGRSMKTNLLVIGTLVAITAMAFVLPATITPVNAVCARAGSTVACAGGSGAFAKTDNTIAKAFGGTAFARTDR